MKITKFLFLIILLISVYPGNAFSVPKNAVTKVSLKEFVSMVLNHSPALNAAKYELKKYDALSRGAGMLYYPSVSLNIQAAPTHKYKCIMPDAWLQSADWGGLSEQEFKEKYCVGTDRDDSITYDLDGYVAKFQISAVFPLYTFGKIKYAKAMAKAAYKAASFKNEAIRDEIRYLAIRAYHARQASLSMGKLMISIEKYVAKAKEKAEEYEENDKISQTDMIRLKLGENELKIRKLEVLKMQTVSLRAMKILSGKNVDIDNLKAPVVDLSMPFSTEKLLESALKNRPEFKLIKSARAMAEARIGLAKSAFYPDLGISAKYTYILSNSDDPKSVYVKDSLHGNSLSVGIGLRLKIEPAKMMTELRIARAERLKIEASYQVFKDKLELEIQKKRDDVVYFINKLKLLNRGIKLSRGWLGALDSQEKMGVVKPKEMVDALVAYFKLKTSKREILFRLQESKRALSRLCGK